MDLRLATTALLATLFAVGCTEEIDGTGADSQDVKEKRGARENVVDAFADGLCEGDSITPAELEQRFGSTAFPISVQLDYRIRSCTAEGVCSVWSSVTLGTYDATMRAMQNGWGYDLASLQTWTVADENGTPGTGTYRSDVNVGFDDSSGRLEPGAAAVTDSISYSFPFATPPDVDSTSATTSIDGACTRTIARMPSSPIEGGGTFEFEYATYASLRTEPAANVQITEVDYDQPGSDTAEFIEIKNLGDMGAGLDGVELQLIDGQTDEPYFVVDLGKAASVLAPGKTIVVGAKSLADQVGDAAYLRLRANLQNGPDAVRIFDTVTDEVLDEIRYGTAAEKLADGTTRPALKDSGKGSICREDGAFTSCKAATPGR